MSAAHICGSTAQMSSKMARPFVTAPKQHLARAPVRILTLAMAKSAKAADLRTEFATNEAIDAEVQQLKKDLFNLRIKFAKREDYNPAQMLATRKRVAQLLTIRRERDIAAGIDKRASREAEKAKLVDAGLGKFS